MESIELVKTTVCLFPGCRSPAAPTHTADAMELVKCFMGFLLKCSSGGGHSHGAPRSAAVLECFFDPEAGAPSPSSAARILCSGCSQAPATMTLGPLSTTTHTQRGASSVHLFSRAPPPWNSDPAVAAMEGTELVKMIDMISAIEELSETLKESESFILEVQSRWTWRSLCHRLVSIFILHV